MADEWTSLGVHSHTQSQTDQQSTRPRNDGRILPPRSQHWGILKSTPLEMRPESGRISRGVDFWEVQIALMLNPVRGTPSLSGFLGYTRDTTGDALVVQGTRQALSLPPSPTLSLSLSLSPPPSLSLSLSRLLSRSLSLARSRALSLAVPTGGCQSTRQPAPRRSARS